MIKVGIVGGTGYTGVELIRLLSRHPQAQVTMLTSRSEAGRRVDDMFPSLRGVTDLTFSDLDEKKLDVEYMVILVHPPMHISMAHTDTDGERPSTLTMNMEVFNCRDTYTSFYHCEKELTQHTLNPNGYAFTKYDHADNLEYVAEYTLHHPVIFNRRKIHQVINPTFKRRISVSFRFHNTNEEILRILAPDIKIVI